jgi:hypothetical protein
VGCALCEKRAAREELENRREAGHHADRLRLRISTALALTALPLAAGAEEPKPTGTHAPEWALWAGARLGIIGFGNSFYAGPRADTTGNWVQAGGSLEVDAGARLGQRHVPYVFYEQSLIAPGRKLDGTGAVITTRFFGVGFRYTAFNPDFIGFVADVSVGWRTLAAYQHGQTYEMSGLETFRLGLGAEMRLSTHFVLSPLGYISGGVMTNTSGSITFLDGTMPPFKNGQGITDQRGYLVIGIGIGAHFDLIGK